MQKRVAIYIRVSTREQAEEGYSLAAQESTLTAYCAERGYTIHKIYRDEGISAKDIKRRPQMQELIRDAGRGLFDIVIVWKLTRFTRSLTDLCNTCDYLDRHGVTFVSYSESFDCSTPVGRMIRNILGTIAQWEREVISENVKAAMTERASQGKRTCSYVLGYDKDGDSLMVNHAEAEIVTYIFDMFLRHRNLSVVAGLCKSKGYRGKKGGEFRAWSIQQILTRPIYAGYNSFVDQLYKGDYPAIISPKKFNATQQIISKLGLGRKRIIPVQYVPTKR